MSAAPARAAAAFREEFGADPEVVATAPGRVNLIGEHTDYNEGFVLPMALDLVTAIAARRREDPGVRLRSLDAEGAGPYVEAVRSRLVAAGHSPPELEGVIATDLPVGGGLSSSASLCVATIRALCAAGDLSLEPLAAARLARAAEHELGVPCGIMDPLASACGTPGSALFLDCRSLEFSQLPLPAGVEVRLMDSGERRGLAGSAYAERLAACREAARLMGVPALRDAALEDVEGLPEPLRRRARHVVSENLRTVAAAEALREGDAEVLGRLLDLSHESLRVDYEVSSAALDAIVAAARGEKGCLGARMTGAGFGGYAVALFRK